MVGLTLSGAKGVMPPPDWAKRPRAFGTQFRGSPSGTRLHECASFIHLIDTNKRCHWYRGRSSNVFKSGVLSVACPIVRRENNNPTLVQTVPMPITRGPEKRSLRVRSMIGSGRIYSCTNHDPIANSLRPRLCQ